jgi:hypothetical protein
MKRILKFGITAVVVISIVLVLGSCKVTLGTDDDGGGGGGGGGKVIDWTSHNTDYSILIRNNTNYKLVAFKGELDANKLIGGIPAHANNHGLPFDPVLFDKTEDFPLILLTEDQYNTSKANLSSQKNSPFTRVYVFYNKAGDNNVEYEIAEGLGGNNKLRIINSSTTLNVEIRLGGVAGETVGYAPANMLETVLKINDGNYSFFPVFKRYNKIKDVVETVYPKRDDGQPWRLSTSFGDLGNGTTVDEFTMNLNNLLKNIVMTSGIAWVVIDNQTNQGVRFMEGATPRKTLSGLENIPSGKTLTWQIDMAKLSSNNYADSRVVSSWAFGPIGDEVGLQTSETDNTKLGSLTVYRDKMYTITVKGEAGSNTNPLKAWVSETTDIDVSDFNM